MKAPKMPLQIVHFNIACVVSQTSSLIMAIFQLQPKPMESFRFWNYEQLIVLANTNTDCPGAKANVFFSGDKGSLSSLLWVEAWPRKMGLLLEFLLLR